MKVSLVFYCGGIANHSLRKGEDCKAKRRKRKRKSRFVVQCRAFSPLHHRFQTAFMFNTTKDYKNTNVLFVLNQNVFSQTASSNI
ncbi:hypothetical protein HMPREF9120_01709 [Neisseria sp. oral taxon 020 str. F0370]|nr:hypothetical protein HMPREF9120_01709 [Neisseria sp. oral taxon 020 str. F0370]